MTLDNVLHDLIQHLETKENSTLAWEQTQQWPEGAVQTFQDAGWIKLTVPAKSLVCPGCEENCFMPVHSVPASKADQPARNYVACDQRSDMGRIPIPPEMLQQWQITENQVTQWLARELGLRGKPKKDKTTKTIQIGEVQGKKQSGRLELGGTEPVSLKTSGHSLLLIDVIYFKGKELQVDKKAIAKMVDRPPPTDRYKPSIARQEAGKLKTQEMYKSWRKAHREWKIKRPKMSDEWYSQQIEKMEIAQDRKAETIRRRLKK